MSRPLCVLIIASPGPFRDGLRILLQAIPDITHVTLADTLVGGWRSIFQQPPDAAVVDADLFDQARFETQLKYLMTLMPNTRSLIIVHTQNQQQRVQSADLPALLAGFTAEDLFASIFV